MSNITPKIIESNDAKIVFLCNFPIIGFKKRHRCWVGGWDGSFRTMRYPFFIYTIWRILNFETPAKPADESPGSYPENERFTWRLIYVHIANSNHRLKTDENATI